MPIRSRVRDDLRRWCVLLVCALLSWSPPAHADAHADDTRATPQTVGQLLRAFGIQDAPADFVVVVDTSSSMMDPPALYPPVAAAYRKLVRAVGDQDNL